MAMDILHSNSLGSLQFTPELGLMNSQTLPVDLWEWRQCSQCSEDEMTEGECKCIHSNTTMALLMASNGTNECILDVIDCMVD